MEETLEIVSKNVDLQVSCGVGWVRQGFSHPGAREGWVWYLGPVFSEPRKLEPVLKILTFFTPFAACMHLARGAGQQFSGQVKGRLFPARGLKCGVEQRRSGGGGGERGSYILAGGECETSSAAARRVNGAHGPVTLSLDKICQDCAPRAHQGCGSLPKPSSFIIATVNQCFKTKSEPGRTSPGDQSRRKEGGGVGEVRGKGREVCQKLAEECKEEIENAHGS